MADILLGNVRGPIGPEGQTGATGETGQAATIEIGSVSTTAYGNPAQVVNSGTEEAAILDFTIPQGKPGEQTTRMGALTLDTITAQTATFPVPAVGETGSTVFGKIIKFFTDTVSALASKLNVSDVINNLTSTATDKPLSANMGRQLNSNLNTALAYSSTTEGITGDIKAYRWGRIVYLSFENATINANTPANQRFSSITEKYCPIYNISFVDSASQSKRIVVGANGYIFCTEAITAGSIIRGGVTYIAKTE